MKLHQLSLFLENRVGHLKAPCRVLAEAGINIIALSLADTQQFGILRLIVKEWQRAYDVLKAAQFAVTLTEVVAIDVEDRPGGLAGMLEIMERHGLDIEYMYAFSAGASQTRAALIFRFADTDQAIRALLANGVNVLDSVKLFQNMG